MHKDKLQDLKREALRMRRKLDNISDRQEKDRALKTYARLLYDIKEAKKLNVENPGLLILNK